MKEALFELARRGLTRFLSLVVHDEIILTRVPPEIAEDVRWELQDIMETIMHEKACPLLETPAEVKVRDTWFK